MRNSLEGLKPKFLNDMIRVGAAFDGGYLINERAIRSSKCLLSFGVNDDWSFEADFLNRVPDLMVLCLDYSVSKQVFLKEILNSLKEILSGKFLSQLLSFDAKAVRERLLLLRYWTMLLFRFSLFFGKDNVRFCSKGISNEKSGDFITLEDVFHMLPPEILSGNSVFIKMDIEQSEFQVLPDLLRFQEYVNGVAVEFHDLDALWPSFVEIMDKLKVNFEITHIHGNNYAGLIPNSMTPRVLEITFLKKNLIQEKEPARQGLSYPILELDRPNNRLEDDLPLKF
jgi:hypothetical protein